MRTRLEARLARRIGSARPAINYPFTKSPNYQMGFTLIELLVVITLVVVLSSVALVGYRNSVQLAREATLKDDLFKLREAIDQHYADKNAYPPTLDALVSEGYIRAMPVDPFTRSASSWEAVPSEPDPNNPTAAPGIQDVKSGAEGTAIDGTPYAEW